MVGVLNLGRQMYHASAPLVTRSTADNGRSMRLFVRGLDPAAWARLPNALNMGVVQDLLICGYD
jgi:hypothetical protein